MPTVNPIPEAHPRVTPYLPVAGAGAAIEFYTEVFGTTERVRMPGDSPDGVGHAELGLGNSVIMLADEFPDRGVLAPTSIGGSPVTLHVYVKDVDAPFDRALHAGARSVQEPTDQFYGDRSGQFEDPFGHRWKVASHIEDVPPDELQ